MYIALVVLGCKPELVEPKKAAPYTICHRNSNRVIIAVQCYAYAKGVVSCKIGHFPHGWIKDFEFCSGWKVMIGKSSPGDVEVILHYLSDVTLVNEMSSMRRVGYFLE